MSSVVIPQTEGSQGWTPESTAVPLCCHGTALPRRLSYLVRTLEAHCNSHNKATPLLGSRESAIIAQGQRTLRLRVFGFHGLIGESWPPGSARKLLTNTGFAEVSMQHPPSTTSDTGSKQGLNLSARLGIPQVYEELDPSKFLGLY